MKSTPKYSFEFAAISKRNGSVRYFHPNYKQEMEVGFAINDQDLSYRAIKEYPTAVADLLDLAVAIYASDRLSSQELNTSQCEIYVHLPVRNPDLLNSTLFKAQLSELLEWSTGSRWDFNFTYRETAPRNTEEQLVIPTSSRENTEVALWSGGLDALAGIYTRIKLEPEKKFVLFGTGANSNIHKRQFLVFDALQRKCSASIQLCRMPLTFSNSNLHKKNKISRARGLVFMMLGSVCSSLMGQSKLYVYENGIGAINLPYRSSSAGLDHSRATHPLTLLKVSDVISHVLNSDFRVINPFIFWTKAQMCRSLAQEQQVELVSLTMSCDSPHRKRINQCGYCSSCLLRRQSLLASGIDDKTPYVLLHGEQKPVKDPTIALRHMLHQVGTFKHLLNLSGNPKNVWSSLAYQFPALDDIVDQTTQREGSLPSKMRESIIQLYKNYTAEWDTVSLRVSEGLLNMDESQPESSRLLASAHRD